MSPVNVPTGYASCDTNGSLATMVQQPYTLFVIAFGIAVPIKLRASTCETKQSNYGLLVSCSFMCRAVVSTPIAGFDGVKFHKSLIYVLPHDSLRKFAGTEGPRYPPRCSGDTSFLFAVSRLSTRLTFLRESALVAQFSTRAHSPVLKVLAHPAVSADFITVHERGTTQTSLTQPRALDAQEGGEFHLNLSVLPMATASLRTIISRYIQLHLHY
jgi:hypothetical protein